jgi:hypothetical protein
MAYAWSAQQLMNMADSSIADYCSRCGYGFRVWKPGSVPPSIVGGRTDGIRRELPPKVAPAARVPEAQQVANTLAPRFQYKVVPFIGQSKGSLSAADVAEQLEFAIRR